jgi:hypothetical protein
MAESSMAVAVNRIAAARDYVTPYIPCAVAGVRLITNAPPSRRVGDPLRIYVGFASGITRG